MLLRDIMPVAGFGVMKIVQDFLFYLAEFQTAQVTSVSREYQPSGFFRNCHDKGICALRHSHSGTVAQSKVRGQMVILTDWQNTTRGFDPAFVNDHSTIVQGTVFVKDSQQQSAGYLGV